MDTSPAFQEEIWDELINGQIVQMSPRPTTNHNQIAFNIAVIFANYLKGKPCTPFADGTGLYLTENDRFVPDGMIVCDPEKIQHNGVHGAPDLVVEVLSLSTAKRDRGYKKEAYARAGVKEYWLVEPATKSVEQYLLKDGQLSLQEIYAIPPDYLLEDMTKEERAAVITQFKCSLYDDLNIKLADVFDRVR